MRYLKNYKVFENKEVNKFLDIPEIESKFLDISDIMIDWEDNDDIEVTYNLVTNPNNPITFDIGKFESNKFISPFYNNKDILTHVIKSLRKYGFYYKVDFRYTPGIINHLRSNPDNKYGELLKKCYLEVSKRIESVFDTEIIKSEVYDAYETRWFNLTDNILNDHQYHVGYKIYFKI